MATVVQNGLMQRDRIFTVSVMLPDKPGQLAAVSALIAKEQGNVIKLEHNVFANVNRTAGVELTITLESSGNSRLLPGNLQDFRNLYVMIPGILPPLREV